LRVPYMPVPVHQAIPSLGGPRVRYRPVMAVRLTAPAASRLFDGLIDSGADDTVFADSIATTLGIDLQGAEERSVHLVGRPQPIRVRYALTQLLITDGGQETYEWAAVVGFVSGRLHYNLLGQAGFLQFFDCNLRGEPDHEAILAPKASFPGRRL
jgi:hypothetical protein